MVMNHSSSDLTGFEVAVIGLAGRFPKSRNVEELWKNLIAGRECITFFSDEELRSLGWQHGNLDDPRYVKAGAILDDVELFDAAFFGFSPREAEIVDPQQRIFLECAWEALENAGYNPDTYPGLIGVFAGCSDGSYLLPNLLSNQDLVQSAGIFQLYINNSKDSLATRVSYKLNLRGPSMSVQTACSTSLVAVHMACQSLISGESDLALAGGVSVQADERHGYMYEEGSIFSPDGHCRPFDAKAAGTVGGNGVGIVVLKRLADALADRDEVRAVIRGSAINNDGALKMSFSAPSVEGQVRVIRAAHLLTGIPAETISYVEAHGTGTTLGDPIELAALTQAFRAGIQKKQYCAIGSIKANIGHLDAAAGVTSVIKTTLALQHGQIPPSINFEHPNPEIDFANGPFYVNTRLAEWKANGGPRRAGINGFGVGGTNVHIIMEEAPAPEASVSSRPWQVLMLSGRTENALEQVNANLAQHLQRHPELNPADVAYTLQVGRRAFGQRRCVLCQSVPDAIQQLQQPDPARVLSQAAERDNAPVVFLFPGQGAQYAGMGRDLYENELFFRQQVDDCCDRLQPHLGFDLRPILYPPEGESESATQQLTQTGITQPALFVIEYALARFWMHCGIQPQAMIGHSLGEYVAACLAGVFSLDDALRLVAARGRLMQALPGGSMLAVPLSEKEISSWLEAPLSLAAVNAPELCTVSGPTEAVEALQQRLAAQQIDSRPLHTSHAFHSAMMDPILESFRQTVSQVKLAAPQIPYLSNVSGEWITPQEATNPDYWVRHIRQGVRFGEGMRILIESSEAVFLEVGPGHALSSLARQQPAARGRTFINSLRHPQESESDLVFWLKALGRLWLAGGKIDWNTFYAGEQRRRVSLPSYPFERQRYWVEAKMDAFAQMANLRRKEKLADWFYLPTWKRSTPPHLLPPLKFGTEQPCWLVFCDDMGIGRLLAERLEAAHHPYTLVWPSERFERLPEGMYSLRPDQLEDYQLLVKDLKAQDRLPQVVAHLWSVTSETRLDNELAFAEVCRSRSFQSLLCLVQALSEHRNGALQICAISNQLQDVTGSETTQPEKALLIGPCRVIPQEYVNVTCRAIDIQLPLHKQADPLADILFAESLADSKDTLVAYRGGQRWVQTFEPLPLNQPPIERLPLREKGVYLITGGLGGIGLALAEYLAQNVHARLILTGRSALPERSAWESWLSAHPENDSTSQKIHKVQQLEALGGEVLVTVADVADEATMRTTYLQAIEQWGAVHGIIHSAGVAGGEMIQTHDPQVSRRVLMPKVQGSLVLETLFAQQAPDFVVYCSSLAALLGGMGQVYYCAANAFLDALAHAKAVQTSIPHLAINWGAWMEIGMAVNTAAPEEIKRRQAEQLRRTGIPPQQGIQAFTHVLGSGLPQVAVSTQDLPLLIEQSRTLESGGMMEMQQAAANRPKHARPATSSAYLAPRDENEAKIVQIWQDALGLEQVGVNDNFFELGGHSLLATMITTRLREVFQINLSVRELFKSSTVAQLAEAIRQIQAGAPAETEIDQIAQALQQIESLSPEQIQALLEQDNGEAQPVIEAPGNV